MDIFKSNKIKIIILIFILIVAYGFYEKNRRVDLIKSFDLNKPIICGGMIVKRSNGWFIHHNRFFSNGKIAKTIVFCKKK